MDFGRRAGRPHQHHGLARLQQRAKIGAAAHLQHDDRHEAPLRIGPGAGHRQAFHREQRRADGSVDARRVHLVILQPVELAGPEGPRRRGRTQHHFDDRRRQAVHRVHRGAQLVPASRDQTRRR